FVVAPVARAHTCPPLPAPATSGVNHIVFVMPENRSFDHFLGWLPNADGRQAGLTYFDASGTPHPTYSALGTSWQYTAPTGDAGDPDHWIGAPPYPSGGPGMRGDWSNGLNDGWVYNHNGTLFSISYYPEDPGQIGDHLGFLSSFARTYRTLDRYFSSIMSQTFPNR